VGLSALCLIVPEALDERHGPTVAVVDAEGAAPVALPGEDALEVAAEQGRKELGIARQMQAKLVRQRQHELAVGSFRQQAIHQMRGAVRGASCPATWAQAARSRQPEQPLVAAGRAPEAIKTVGRDAAELTIRFAIWDTRDSTHQCPKCGESIRNWCGWKDCDPKARHSPFASLTSRAVRGPAASCVSS